MHCTEPASRLLPQWLHTLTLQRQKVILVNHMPLSEGESHMNAMVLKRSCQILGAGSLAALLSACAVPQWSGESPSSPASIQMGGVRGHADLQKLAAERLMQFNPGRTYSGPPPETLLAIPVIEVDLNADGSVRHMTVLRRPGQAHDTVQLAMDAIRRAAPYGDLRHMPKPWRFTETFLFDQNRHFKPRTLDQ